MKVAFLFSFVCLIMLGQNQRLEGGELAATAGELRAVIGRLVRKFREEAHLGDFTWSQLKVLIRLEREGPATVTSLALAEGMKPQSMGETLSVLKAAGMIHASPDPDDGRRTVLSLSDACREKVRASRAAREDWLVRSIRANLTPDEERQLAAAVILLKRVVDLEP